MRIWIIVKTISERKQETSKKHDFKVMSFTMKGLLSCVEKKRQQKASRALVYFGRAEQKPIHLKREIVDICCDTGKRVS